MTVLNRMVREGPERVRCEPRAGLWTQGKEALGDLSRGVTSSDVCYVKNTLASVLGMV